MSNLFEHLDIEFEEINKLGIVEITMVKGERGSSGDYENLSHLPKINGVTVTGNKTSEDYGIDVIEDYNELSNLPKINNVTLTGNKTSADLSLASQSSMQNAELRLTVVENKIATIADPTDEQVAEAVDAWLDEHPEATTTVEDGAVTFPKLASDVADLFINEEATAGDIVSFDDGAKNIPLKDLTLDIEAVQSGSGDPSPTNVRPISGWDEVNVNVTGINVWGEEWELGSLNFGTGQPVSSSSAIRSKNYINVLPNTRYFAKTPSAIYVFFYDSSHSFITVGGVNNTLFDSPNNAYYMKFVKDGTTYNHDISINYPSTDHDYHAYNGQTYTTDLDGTRYGGTLDVTTGVLTITHGIVDLGSLTWTYNSTYSLFAATASSDTPTVLNSGANDVICEAYKHYYTGAKIVLANIENGSIVLNTASFSNSKRWLIKNTDYTDGATFKTSLNGVHAVYELATPQTVQLTPTQVTTLLGQNNVWCDTGEVTNLEYRADTKLYIDKAILSLGGNS